MPGAEESNFSDSSRVMVMETEVPSAYARECCGHIYEDSTKFFSRHLEEQEWVSLSMKYYGSGPPRGRGLIQI